jgi:hypothetical protein
MTPYFRDGLTYEDIEVEDVEVKEIDLGVTARFPEGSQKVAQDFFEEIKDADFMGVEVPFASPINYASNSAGHGREPSVSATSLITDNYDEEWMTEKLTTYLNQGEVQRYII